MRLTECSNKATLFVSGVAVSLLLSTNIHAAGKNGIIAYPCRTAGLHQDICLIDPNKPGAAPSSPITSGVITVYPVGLPTARPWPTPTS